jgi:hypothetical protein
MTQYQHSSLNAKQRELLDLVGSRFRDRETFEQRHPELKDTGLFLTKMQIAEMRSAFFSGSRWQQSEDFRKLDHALQTQDVIAPEQMNDLVDAIFVRSFQEERREFAQLDAHLKQHGLTLSTEQMKELREALLACSREDQGRDFAAINESMRDTSMPLPAEMLIRLGDHLFARSRAEHLAEFEQIDEYMQSMPEEETLFSFAPDDVVVEPPTDALDAIPMPRVIDADRVPLDVVDEKRTAMNELRKRPEGQDGLINRMSDAINFKAGSQHEKPMDVAAAMCTPENMFAAMLLVMALLGGFILPGYLNSKTASKPVDQHIVEAQEQADSAEIDLILQPDEIKNAPSTGSIALPVPKQMAPDVSTTILPESEDTVPARIARIQALLKANKRAQAQKLCISTMKRKLNKAQFDAVWSLMRQSLEI